MGGKAWLFLIQVDGDEVEMNRRAAAQRQQNLQQAITVFSSRETDHDLVALLDHVVVGDGLSYKAAETRL